MESDEEEDKRSRGIDALRKTWPGSTFRRAAGSSLLSRPQTRARLSRSWRRCLSARKHSSQPNRTLPWFATPNEQPKQQRLTTEVLHDGRQAPFCLPQHLSPTQIDYLPTWSTSFHSQRCYNLSRSSWPSMPTSGRYMNGVSKRCGPIEHIMELWGAVDTCIGCKFDVRCGPDGASWAWAELLRHGQT